MNKTIEIEWEKCLNLRISISHLMTLSTVRVQPERLVIHGHTSLLPLQNPPDSEGVSKVMDTWLRAIALQLPSESFTQMKKYVFNSF
ncbi:MAG: hypothetical protein Q7T21_15235 [Gallionella sp.]|nr:hypothetical protein [Gallionella sp.]